MRVNRFIDEENKAQMANIVANGDFKETPNGPMFNICGMLVHSAVGREDDVQQRLVDLPGVEIHGAADDGRIVVTVEDTDETLAAETMTAINQLPGVAAAALVYHHFEPRESIEREEVSS